MFKLPQEKCHILRVIVCSFLFFVMHCYSFLSLSMFVVLCLTLVLKAQSLNFILNHVIDEPFCLMRGDGTTKGLVKPVDVGL